MTMNIISTILRVLCYYLIPSFISELSNLCYIGINYYIELNGEGSVMHESRE